MNQTELIARITEVLSARDRIQGAFLGGSFGRGEADVESDVDVYVVVANAEDIPSVLNELAGVVREVAPILFANVLPNARTINSITMDWLRFDFTVVSQGELAYFARDQLKPLFDRANLFETLRANAEHRRNLSADGLLDIVNEFIRVVGLSVVVKGRDDAIVAQTGTNLLRDMLIRVMVLENGAQPPRGALSLKRNLTAAQFAALKDLPALDATWPAIFARTSAIAEQFLPRAHALAVELGAAWPEEFERVTLAHVQAKVGVAIRHGESHAVSIRAERLGDYAVIGDIIRQAFAGKPYADGDEAELVEALRGARALSVSLVAQRDGEVIGQIALSPAYASDGTPGWYALGPVAVLPAHQGEGVGAKLVREGLRIITESGAAGCILVGDPVYYTRFGFRLSPSNAPAGEPPEFFMVKVLGRQDPVGPIAFHAAFES